MEYGTFTSGTATKKGVKRSEERVCMTTEPLVNCGNASLPSGPITIVAVHVAETCSYISGEVHVKQMCRLRRKAHSYTKAKLNCH